jgi:curved DNA-binding protein CbpA
MKSSRNYYLILHVQPDAPYEVIRSSYRALMRDLRLHPDQGGDGLSAALINEAYDVLSNDSKRAAYDRLNSSNSDTPAGHSDKPGAEIALPPVSPLPTITADRIASKTKRTFERLQKNSRIQYCTSDLTDCRTATMIDFSPNGIRFHCSSAVSLNQFMKIIGPFFRAEARVVNFHRRIEDGRQDFDVGARFLALNIIRNGVFCDEQA